MSSGGLPRAEALARHWLGSSLKRRLGRAEGKASYNSAKLSASAESWSASADALAEPRVYPRAARVSAEQVLQHLTDRVDGPHDFARAFS